MAISDYICCSRCETKLIYDGDQGNRRWWKEQFGSEVNIKCPKCAWVGLTGNEARNFYEKYTNREELIYAIDEFLEEKNT